VRRVSALPSGLDGAFALRTAIENDDDDEDDCIKSQPRNWDKNLAQFPICI
jgi:hypothetical protein